MPRSNAQAIKGPKGRRWFAALIIGGFSSFGLFFGLLVADALNPSGATRAETRSTLITAADGQILRAFLARDGRWRLPVRETQVDPRFIRYLLAWEDQRFASHPGVDPLAILRAAYQLAREARVVSGASTLTMQVARLIEPRERTISAKAFQIARAMQLEYRYSKQEILELYLTLAPYGGNLEGVRAAALAWFGKEPKLLTTAEAALLVALPQAPERRRPDRFPVHARIARDRVLDTLADRGLITPAEASEAKAEPIPGQRVAFPFHAPHLSERIARSAQGLEAASTVQFDVQVKLEDLVARESRMISDGAMVAVIAVDNETRSIIGHVSGADFWGQAGQVDLTRRPRSPGSALKPFIYGIAFDDLAIHPQTLIDDKPTLFGDYAPRNFDRAFQGTVSIRQALQSSLNVPAVALLDRVGPVRLSSILSHAGAGLVFPTRGAIPSLPLALGGVGISLEDMTMLYAAVPNGGDARPLRVRATDPEGGQFRIFGETAAWYLGDILRGSPLPDGWSMGQGVVRRRMIGFKTGTSYGYRDAWAIGFSPRYTVGVWAGRADGSTRPGYFGRNEAAPLLLRAFELLPQEAQGLPRPPADVIVAENAEKLPKGLQRFRVRASDPAGLKRSRPPRITFPPDGAVIALPAGDDPPTLAFKAQGGEGELRWIIDGTPVPGGQGPQIYWAPEGEGFTQVTVVDSEGRSHSTRVRLKPAS